MTDQSNMPTVPNAAYFDDVMKQARRFGRETAAGADAKPKLGYAVARAVAAGAIDLNETDDRGKDQVERVYEAYVHECSTKAIHHHTGVKQKSSELRQIAKAAALPTCDFVGVLNRLMPRRNELAKAGDNKVKGAFPAMVAAARLQQQRDVDLTDDEIDTAIQQKPAEEKTEEKEVKRAFDILDRLITGEKGLTDRSEEVTEAHRQLKQRLTAITLAERKAVALAEMRELGFEVVEQAA